MNGHEKYPTLEMLGIFGAKVFKNGILIDEFEQKNLIVTSAGQISARSLGGDAAYKISKIAFGSNNTAPAVGNALPLTNQFIKAVDTTTYPAVTNNNQVRFDWSLGASENNGATIWEFALCSNNTTPIMFSRIVRSSAINKTSDVTVNGYWIIQY